MFRRMTALVCLVLFVSLVAGCTSAPVRFRLVHFNTQKAEEISAYYGEASLPYQTPGSVVKLPPTSTKSTKAETPVTGIIEILIDRIFGILGRIELFVYERGAIPAPKAE